MLYLADSASPHGTAVSYEAMETRFGTRRVQDRANKLVSHRYDSRRAGPVSRTEHRASEHYSPAALMANSTTKHFDMIWVSLVFHFC